MQVTSEGLLVNRESLGLTAAGFGANGHRPRRSAQGFGLELVNVVCERKVRSDFINITLYTQTYGVIIVL